MICSNNVTSSTHACESLIQLRFLTNNYSIYSPLPIGRRSSGSILMGLGGDGESGDFLTVKQKRLRPAVSHAVWLYML